MTIGDNIRRIAEEKGITIYRISKEGKMSNGYLSDLVNNKQTNPSVTILKKIAKVLNVNVEDLIN